MIVNLTQHFVDNELVCNQKTAAEYVDNQRSGLYIKVTKASSGIGTYFLRYKNSFGKTAHQKIGRTNEISLNNARQKALQLKSEITSGVDLQEKAKRQKHTLTLAEFFYDHYLPHSKSRKRSWKKDESMFRLRVDDTFGKKLLTQVNRKDVTLFHTNLLDQEQLSPASCDHYLKLLRRMLNLAVEWEMLEKNPLSRISLFREDNKVENYLDDEQLRKLLHVLHTHKNRMTCNVMLFLLSTGARLNEALSAKWIQIDEEKRLWLIPASNSKSKRVRSVPLNQSALDVLKSLGTKGKFEHLFVNLITGKRLVSVHTGWKLIREQAGLPNLRIHDLRHSFASFLVNNGRTLYEVQQILGHSVPTVTQRYSHLSTKTLLSASDAASLAISNAS
jgi:integrase